jgi:N-acetylglutamate synthase-like GNAT family acetyltransferase
LTLLRPARQEDAAAIRALIRQVGINPLGLDWRRFLLAVDGNDRPHTGGPHASGLIGCGQLKPHAGGSLELASIAVVPERRRQGIASEIIQALIVRADREHNPGEAALYLTCRAGLRTFYEQFGFQVLEPGEMPPYFKAAYQAFQLLRLVRLAHEPLLVMRRTPGR